MGVCETVSVVSILISLDLALASQFQQPVDLQESHKAVHAWEENLVLESWDNHLELREYAFYFSSEQVRSLPVGTILAILRLCRISFHYLDKTAPCAHLKVEANH